jgi:hypothetical protein
MFHVSPVSDQLTPAISYFRVQGNVSVLNAHDVDGVEKVGCHLPAKLILSRDSCLESTGLILAVAARYMVCIADRAENFVYAREFEQFAIRRARASLESYTKHISVSLVHTKK